MHKEYYKSVKQQEMLKLWRNAVLDNYDISVSPDCVKLFGQKLVGMMALRLAYVLMAANREAASDIANQIIGSLNLQMCHFSPMVSFQLLDKYEERLSKASVKILRNYLERVVDNFLDNELDFIGVNDNFPLMATYTALMGYKLFGRTDLLQAALRRLEQIKCLLKRRGVMSEYTAPGYSILQLYVTAELVAVAPTQEIKEIAMSCEERLWADVLFHYHPETGRLSGPNSRANIISTSGDTEPINFIMEALFAEYLKAAPTDFNIVDYCPNCTLGTVYYLDTTFHCPKYLVEKSFRRCYPFSISAQTEFCSSTDSTPEEAVRNPETEDYFYEYSAGTADITTYMTERYSLGTATRPFHNGVQTNIFYLIYKRTQKILSRKDFGVVFCRYLINDDANKAYPDQGRALAFQHKNTAMVLYKPKIAGNKPFYSGLPTELEQHYKKQEISGNIAVSSLKLSLFFPCENGTVDEIWLGEHMLNGFCGSSRKPCSVWIKDSDIYMAFHPLLLNDYECENAVEVTIENNYIVVSFCNYKGDVNDFSKRGFLLTGNGFIAEISDKNESGEFLSFRKKYADFQLEDSMNCSAHSRQTYVRTVTYRRGEIKLQCEYSPVSEGIKQISVNDTVAASPKLKISDFDETILPYM